MVGATQKETITPSYYGVKVPLNCIKAGRTSLNPGMATLPTMKLLPLYTVHIILRMDNPLVSHVVYLQPCEQLAPAPANRLSTANRRRRRCSRDRHSALWSGFSLHHPLVPPSQNQNGGRANWKPTILDYHPVYSAINLH